MKRGTASSLSRLPADLPSFVQGSVMADLVDAGLMELAPLPDAVLDGEVSEAVAEWVRGWDYAELLRANHCSPPGPVLLYGPTGTGKTTTARLLSTSFKSPRPAGLMEAFAMSSKYLGETGERLGKAFRACARHQALLVVEEIDGLVESRKDGDNGAGQERNSIVVALMRLVELATFPIIATTNRMESLDPALLRRFEFKLAVREPDAVRRAIILEGILGEEPSAALVQMSMADSVPAARRQKRQRILDEAELAEGAA